MKKDKEKISLFRKMFPKKEPMTLNQRIDLWKYNFKNKSAIGKFFDILDVLMVSFLLIGLIMALFGSSEVELNGQIINNYFLSLLVVILGSAYILVYWFFRKIIFMIANKGIDYLEDKIEPDIEDFIDNTEEV